MISKETMTSDLALSAYLHFLNRFNFVKVVDVTLTWLKVIITNGSKYASKKIIKMCKK